MLFFRVCSTQNILRKKLEILELELMSECSKNFNFRKHEMLTS